MRQAGLCDKERTARVDVHHEIEALEGCLFDGAQRQGAGIVYADVDAAKCLHRSCDGILHLVFNTNVARERQRFAARVLHLLGGRLYRAFKLGMRFLRLCRDSDVGAIACGAQCNGKADAAAGSGDE